MNEITTQIIGMLDIKGSLDIARRVYSGGGVSPCINAHGSDTVPKIVVRNNDQNKTSNK